MTKNPAGLMVWLQGPTRLPPGLLAHARAGTRDSRQVSVGFRRVPARFPPGFRQVSRQVSNSRQVSRQVFRQVSRQVSHQVARLMAWPARPSALLECVAACVRAMKC